MSRENAERRQSISIDPRYVGRLAGTLLGICLATALLLGVVNQVTKPRIDAIQREKQEAAMTEMVVIHTYWLPRKRPTKFISTAETPWASAPGVRGLNRPAIRLAAHTTTMA